MPAFPVNSPAPGPEDEMTTASLVEAAAGSVPPSR
jgi:hypothetical protein